MTDPADPGRELIGELNAYDAAAEGTVLPRFQVSVDRGRQRRYHRACGIDTKRFGDIADVTILAQDNAVALTRADLPNDGRIHTRHVVRQRQVILLNEPLVLNGRIAGYRNSHRGRFLTCTFAFLRPDLTVPLEMEGEYLLPFETPDPGPRKRTARASDQTSFEEIGALALTPEKVREYSKEVGNDIHFDPAFARARGYRAPLTQGLMLLTAMHGALISKVGMPQELDLDIEFRRPVFWDQKLPIVADSDTRTLRCLNDDDKVAAEATIQHLTQQSDA